MNDDVQARVQMRIVGGMMFVGILAAMASTR